MERRIGEDGYPPRVPERPCVVVIGGPNGAGKTTISRAALSESFGLTEFVNADAIASGLSGFDPARSAIEAGRVMLKRLRDLASRRTSFAFETTLASRTFAPWLRQLLAEDYEVHLLYVWLRTPKLAVKRVHERVLAGGHAIPSDVIERRYVRSCANLLRLYVPLATSWRILDNSGKEPKVVSFRSADAEPVILLPKQWRKIHEVAQRAQRAGTEDLG
jgi:predicted ABC-type ATPase